MTKATIEKHLGSQQWRLNNLYYIMDKNAKRIPFRMNWAQRKLFRELHYQNVILKARQLGFTTFLQIFMLDACIFNDNIRAGTIAHTLGDVQTIFRDKIKFAYDNLPDWLKAEYPCVSDTREELVFRNGSSIRVAVSMRSGTLQYLHISEFGKICAKDAEKAKEIRTGALNTIEAGNFVFVESTAEGKSGDFYEMCKLSQEKERKGEELTPLDMKFHFYPWWQEPGYQLDPKKVVIPAAMETYFDKLKLEHQIDLTAEQKAWYVKKAESQRDEMKREYPSTPNESFEAAIEGAYYSKQIAQAERDGRIGRVPWEPKLKVYTSWDLGHNDSTAIWFVQIFRKEVRCIDFYQNSGEGLAHYAKILSEKPYTYANGRHIYPHDADVTELGSGKSRIATLNSLNLRGIVLPRSDLLDGIEAVRNFLAKCWFDEAKCAEGLDALRRYRKEFDEKNSVWRDHPKHDDASNPADSFRYLALGLKDEHDDAKWAAAMKKHQEESARGVV
jgi:hypothetical protein